MAADRWIKAPTWASVCFGLSPLQLQPLGVQGQLAVAADQPDQPRAGDLRQFLAPGFLLAQDDPLIDDLAGPGITNPLQRDLKAKLAAQLDLHVPDVPGAIDPPGVKPPPGRSARP